MRGVIIRRFLRNNYQDPRPDVVLPQVNYAHAFNRWQRLQIRLLWLFVLFALEPWLAHLKVYAWHILFGTVK